MSSSNLENNKFFAAILLAGIIAMLSGFVANKLVHSEDLDADAFPIEVAMAATDDAPKAEPVAEPIADLIASADIARGKKLSKACAACHSFDNGGNHKIGPNLWGVYNSSKASKAGFKYSSGMMSAGGKWDVASLNSFLWKPKKFIKGTKMNYAGLKKASDRASMVKYLQSLK